MKVFKTIVFFCLVLFLISCTKSNSISKDKLSFVSKTSFIMDTFLTLNIKKSDYSDLLYKDVLNLVKITDKKVNSYTIGSDVYRINQNAGFVPVQVDKETLFLIEKAIEFGDDSEGLFDITFSPLQDCYGFNDGNYRIPSKKELHNSLELVNYKLIELDHASKTVFLPSKKMKINLSGIVKGYILDKITDMLVQRNIQDFSVDFGGNLSVYKNSPITVGIENRVHTKIRKSLNIEKGFISTSSGSHQYFINDGIRYTHIVNPKNGEASSLISSATVKTWSGLESDFLSTYFFLVGENPCYSVKNKYLAQSSVFLFSQEGTFIVFKDNDRT
ncbi:MAG: FAD:protein FMN transferase [Caldisericia bacterium]|nr:FAD:protein FMN transferase [Caldisericia bacterium]